MSIEFETRKETNKLVKWNVGVPRTGMSVKSKSFEVYGYSWNLKFYTSIKFDPPEMWEQWSMVLSYSSDKKNRPRFPLRIYIRDKGRDLYLTQIYISSNDTEIWSSSHSNFKQRYPDVEVAGTRLQLVFDFHLGFPDPETPIKVEKSVQTSNKSVKTSEKSAQTSKIFREKYSENYPCLENLSLDFSKLVEGGTDTDVLLKCGDISIGAHKMILGARSEVFRTMMQSDMVEGREGIVQIIDMEPKILKIFIRYIYTGILPELTVDTALPIYEAADKYQMEALKKRSSHLLVKNLSPDNALVILVAADAHSDCDLKDQLVSYISEKKIPTRKVEWLKFCNEYPKLAVEVLNFMMYQVSPINS